MKKEYSTPIVEKINFNYRDQVVAASSETPIVDPSPKTNGWGSDTCGAAVWWTEFIQFLPSCIVD